MSFEFSRCQHPERWNSFVADSPQGSVFCHTAYLSAVAPNTELYIVEEKGKILLGAVILKNAAGQIIPAPYSFSLYQGVLFGPESEFALLHTRVDERLQLVDFLLEKLSAQEKRISFSLHPSFPDLRSFSWFHYHEKEKGQFKIQLNYTGLIDLHAQPDFSQYVAKIRNNRRRDYKKAQELGLTVEVSNDIATLEHLFRLTFERQEISIKDHTMSLLRSIATHTLEAGIGELLLCKNGEGEAISATLFLHDKNSAYYLIGANHPEFRQSGSGTFLMLENIKKAHARGQNYVDLCGINSPQRGDFKSSFNAAPMPYFVVQWDAPAP